MARILLIVNWYPPDNRVPSRRWGNLTSALVQLGHACTVVSAGNGCPGETVGVAGERVIRLPIVNEKTSTQTKKRRSRVLIPLFQRIVSRLQPPFMRMNRSSIWEQQARSPHLLQLARDSDVVISSFGPIGPLLLGRALTSATETPWIIDVRDSFESKDGKALRPAKSISRKLEGRLLKKASVRITIGRTLAEHLEKSYGPSFEPVYNGWTEEDLCPDTSPAASVPYLYYAGSLYPHQLPALHVLLEAVQISHDVVLKIRLLRDNSRGEITSLLEAFRDSGRIELLPPTTPDRVREELSTSLGAVVLEELGDSPLRNGTVTGKLLGLLASGKPGIAVSSPTGEIRSLASRVPGWHGVDSVEGCIVAIQALARYPARTEGNSRMQEYHVKHQARKLSELLNQTTRK